MRDFADLDAGRKAAYEERTVVGREHDRLRKHAESLPFHPDAPQQEMSVRELVEQLHAFTGAKAANDAKRRELEALRKEWEQEQRGVASLERQVADLEVQLISARNALAGKQSALEAARRRGADLAAEVARLVDPDAAQMERVKAAMGDLENANAKMRDNARRAESMADAAAKKAEYDRLSVRLAEIDEEKRRRLAAAPMPIPGLGFMDDGAGLTLNGVPLGQASQAEKLRVSCAMGFALNPRCKLLLVRDGSLQDDDTGPRKETPWKRPIPPRPTRCRKWPRTRRSSRPSGTPSPAWSRSTTGWPGSKTKPSSTTPSAWSRTKRRPAPSPRRSPICANTSRP